MISRSAQERRADREKWTWPCLRKFGFAMASLPPKPVSSPPPLGKDEDDRRRSRRPSQDDRAYGPLRSRPMADTYIAAYDRRDGDRHRDRDWDRRNWDSRDRGSRGREDDRDRFSHRYDRGRADTYMPSDDRRARRPPSPRRPGPCICDYRTVR